MLSNSRRVPKIFQNLSFRNYRKFDNKGSHTVTHHDASIAIPSPVTLCESTYVQIDSTVLDENSDTSANE
jgi:hypothetical protein